MAVLIWVLSILLFISPLWVVVDASPFYAFDLLMLLVGQWSACALMLWAWFGWWRNKRNIFTAIP